MPRPVYTIFIKDPVIVLIRGVSGFLKVGGLVIQLVKRRGGAGGGGAFYPAKKGGTRL